MIAQGYDIPAVEAWMDKNVGSLVSPFVWTRFEGGTSNLTYLIEDVNGTRAVIRRPPEGDLLPKAHDMGREWRMISSLSGTGVPVPQALAFCEDIDITGAHFYVMEWIDGAPLFNIDDTERLLPEASRRDFAFSFIDSLAALHNVDPKEVGLAEGSGKGSYVARQLKTWYRSWNLSANGANYDDPRMHDMQAYFLDHLPEQESERIVHGDYGTHNVLVGPNKKVAAILDWEISTLGDPLADLGYALNWWSDPADIIAPIPDAATNASGFPSRTELAERYAVISGRDLSKLDYYIAFNHWKVSAISQGVNARYLSGKKPMEGVDMDARISKVSRSIALAEQAVNRIRD